MPTRVLAILVFVYVLNFVDRNLLSILLNSIQRDLGVSDTAMGFLTGPAFAIFYTAAGVPIARLADRHARRVVIAVGLAFWSLATAASGLVRGFAELALARIGVGVGEASATPAAHSLLSDVFPPQRRSTAIAIYNMGASIGIFVGMALGGYLNDALGWRAAFLWLGLPGVAAALLVRFALPEPARGQAEGLADAGAPPRLERVLRHLLALRSFRHLLAAAALYSITGYGMTMWAAPFVERVFGLSPGAFGLSLGLAVGIGGAAGTLLGGLAADRLARRDPRWLLWLPALSCTALVPFLAAAALAPSPGWALALLVPANALNPMYAAPTYAVAQSLAPLRMRAVASATALFAINLVGLGLGPQLIGIANDAFEARHGAQAIRYSLVGLGVFNLWGALHSLWGARSLAADLERARHFGDDPDGADPAPDGDRGP